MKKLLSYILLILISNTSIWAGNPNLINYSKNTYKASNSNWTIDQDSLGIIYFGNNAGLLEFDGNVWKLSNSSNRIIPRAVLTDGKRIYTGSFEEFGYWERNIGGELKYTSLSKNFLNSPLDLGNFDVWRIIKQGNTIYFQSFNGIIRYKDNALTKISSNGLIFLNKVYDELWVQETSGALYRIIDDKLDKVAQSDFFSKTEVRTILPFKDNKYLIATSTSGIYIYDGINFSILNTDKKLSLSEINCGIQCSNGTYYIGSILDGIFELDIDGKITNHFNTQSSLQNNTVLFLYEDKSKNVWAGLDRGISCIQHLQNMSCFIDPTGRIGSVFSVVEFDNKFFVGTNQGLFYEEKTKLKNSSTLSNLTLVDGTQGQVWCLEVIGDKLYCGHNKNLFVIDKNLRASSPYDINSGVYSITHHYPFLFLSTYTSFKTINLLTNKLNNIEGCDFSITKSEIDNLNNLWLENVNQSIILCRMDDKFTKLNSIKTFKSDSSNITNKIRLFKIGGRVLQISGDLFFTYDYTSSRIISEKKLNLCFKGIKDLRSASVIDDNHFWVLGKNIMYKVYYDGITARILEKYDIGYNNLSLVDTHENISQQDSLSYICLDNGFIIYQSPREIPETVPLKKPYFKSILITNQQGEKTYVPIDSISEPHYNSYSITFQYSSQDLLSHNIFFQHKLEGIDEWSELSNENIVRYEHLPKGEYTFIVRTSDQLGNTSEDASYSFEIYPPWIETIWAKFAFLITFMLILFLTWIFILKRYKNEHLKKVREREENRLRRLNDELEHQVKDKDAELLSQTSFIIEKNDLIFRIKNEIDHFYNNQHNKLLAPLYYKINSLLNINMDADHDWKMFLIKFEQKHDTFFKKLKTRYPQLTSNDMKFCACLKINLDSKAISSLMNISVRAVENGRYRIRKKLEIPTNQNLNDFFMNL